MNETLRASTFTTGRWVTLTFSMPVLDPVPDLNVCDS